MCKIQKNIICLSNLSDYHTLIAQIIYNGNHVYSPLVENMNIPNNQFGKLYQIPQPVVCVAGTSSAQGKFTLQLLLREQLKLKGYQVGQLGTEPTSLLYGMDEVFHYGYSVNNNPYFEKTVLYVNSLMNKISNKDPDIILTGVQSGMVSYSYQNLSLLTNRQMEVLTAILPDIVILCINPQDDISFIQRTISAIESYVNTTVLCCVLFPMEYDEKFQVYGKKVKIESSKMKNLICKLNANLSLPVFSLSDENIEAVSDLIISYFSCDN